MLEVVTFFTWEGKNKEETWRVLSWWDVEKKLRLFADLKCPERFTGKRAGMSQVIKNPFLSLAAISYCQVQCILVSLFIPFFAAGYQDLQRRSKEKKSLDSFIS